MKYIPFLVIIVVFVACSSNEESTKNTVSIEDLMREVVEDTKEVAFDKSHIVSDSLALSNVVVSLESLYDTLRLTEIHKLDRYGYNSFLKIRFSQKLNETLSYFDVYQYNFSDSLKLNNAFYNWLDCFGDKCAEIKINKDVKMISTTPSFTLVYDTILVFVKYDVEFETEHIKSFQDSILSKFGSQMRYEIQTDKKGNLKWN